ncbi:MAG: FTR1 family protein [Chloroflexi bacterium]|jgi:high-affinity iron transporter|nr:FTR1 family protein [Chloroflexota bacterium]MBI3174347.1 FTR1 family protein [Chloroflexota bacterium]MCL4270560.1 FTR1 family protein [Anaerolineales bacterium]RJP50920.1 MAG: iron permease [Anaerolineaceae bacterium]
MFASFLLSLREGLEAALIIGIVLGVLVKLKRTDMNGVVWRGVGLAALLSLVAALALNLLGMEFEGRGEEIFEGIAMLLAAGVLTWMILWMKNHGSTLKSEIEEQTNQAALGKGQKALFALAFLAVFREGIELALFLLAARLTSSPLQTVSGALLGLISAAFLGWIVFSSTMRLSLRNFFGVTNILLVIFAAGLVGLGVHEFNEAGIIPSVIENVWNINAILSDKSEVGLLLKALVGYNGNPSLTEVGAYVGYLVILAVILILQGKNQIPASVSTR